MSEQNKQVIRRFYQELVDRRKPKPAEELISPDFDDRAAQRGFLGMLEKLEHIHR